MLPQRLCVMLMLPLLMASLSACSTSREFSQQVKSKLSRADATPLQMVWKAQPELKKLEHNVSIEQVFDRVEAPTVSRITVLQTGLADDSVSAKRSIYIFKRQNGVWGLQSQQVSFKCARGANTTKFQSGKCG